MLILRLLFFNHCAQLQSAYLGDCLSCVLQKNGGSALNTFAFLGFRPSTIGAFVLQEMGQPRPAALRAELADFLEDRDAIPQIIVIALGKWCEIGGSETF